MTDREKGLTEEVREDDPQFLARFKEFRLTSFSVGHQTSVVVLFLIVSVAGFLSYLRIPKESFPEITMPMIAINTMYPGVSPADVETLVTRPIEEELNTISEVQEMISTSVEGYSSILVEFETSVNLDEALAKIREKVDLAKPELPPEAEEPMIVEFNLSELPVLQVNLGSEDDPFCGSHLKFVLGDHFTRTFTLADISNAVLPGVGPIGIEIRINLVFRRILCEVLQNLSNLCLANALHELFLPSLG